MAPAGAFVIALDTNLLVYSHRRRTAEHPRARAAIEKACASPDGCGVALPCLLEFWSVVTHPSSEGRPSTPVEAGVFLRSLIEDGGLVVWIPQPGFWDRLSQALLDIRLSGPRVFDLQIAMIAFDNGASELWTHDAAFVTLPGLRKHDPLGD